MLAYLRTNELPLPATGGLFPTDLQCNEETGTVFLNLFETRGMNGVCRHRDHSPFCAVGATVENSNRYVKTEGKGGDVVRIYQEKVLYFIDCGMVRITIAGDTTDLLLTVFINNNYCGVKGTCY